jgi:hypothetical protein
VLQQTVRLHGQELKPQIVERASARYFVADVSGLDIHDQELFAAVRAAFPRGQTFRVHRVEDQRQERGRRYMVVRFSFPPGVWAFYLSLQDRDGNVARSGFRPAEVRRPCLYCGKCGGAKMCGRAIEVLEEVEKGEVGKVAKAGKLRLVVRRK